MTVVRAGRWAVAAVAVASLALAGCVAPASSPSASPTGSYQGSDVKGLWQLPDIALTDQHGQSTRLRAEQPPFTVVFFGYTNCPDVCTGVLTDLASALQRMDATTRAKIRVLVITTDPARDTPAVMKEYLRRIDPSFVGLTGPLSTIVAAGKTMGVEIEKAQKLPSGGYEVTHSTHVAVYGPDYRSRLMWSAGTQIGTLKSEMEAVVAAG